MHIGQQQTIRNKTAALMVEWAHDREPPFTGESVEGFVDAITAAHLVADEGRLNLHRWVDAARRTGLSWTEIGDALGISKQAAQQRFKPDSDDAYSSEGEETVVRLGATAFNELAILSEEGRKGNELIGIGALRLSFRPTSHLWEYRRIFSMTSMTAEMHRQGWAYVASWLPFHYFKRPLLTE